jgi:cytochrome c2
MCNHSATSDERYGQWLLKRCSACGSVVEKKETLGPVAKKLLGRK